MSLTIDKLATAVATRRGSLALGSAALLGLAQAPSAGAKKKKNCNKKSRKKVDKACGAQVDECNAFYATACAGTLNPAQCQATAALCCEPLSDCDFTGAATCFASLL